jgi:hypothetical protein
VRVDAAPRPRGQETASAGEKGGEGRNACVRANAPCPRGRIFTASADGIPHPRVKPRPQGKRGRGPTSGR